MSDTVQCCQFVARESNPVECISRMKARGGSTSIDQELDGRERRTAVGQDESYYELWDSRLVPQIEEAADHNRIRIGSAGTNDVHT